LERVLKSPEFPRFAVWINLVEITQKTELKLEEHSGLQRDIEE